ncbi:MAG: helix-turn-helix domain-containing protein [Pseudomonadota bacterium]
MIIEAAHPQLDPGSARKSAVRAALLRDFHIEAVFVGVPKLARILGLAPSTIYAHVRAGAFFIPHRMLNTTTMFLVDDVVDWICREPERGHLTTPELSPTCAMEGYTDGHGQGPARDGHLPRVSALLVRGPTVKNVLAKLVARRAVAAAAPARKTPAPAAINGSVEVPVPCAPAVCERCEADWGTLSVDDIAELLVASGRFPEEERKALIALPRERLVSIFCGCLPDLRFSPPLSSLVALRRAAP